jgi:hypothetical protein
MSQLLPFIENHEQLRQCPFMIYGDPAYSTSDRILTPFKGARLTAEQQTWIATMSKVRVSVEWGFGIVKRLFAFIDWSKQQKLMLSPISVLFKVAVLLTNVHTCINGRNQISDFFDMQAPSLDEYLIPLDA